MKKTLQILGTLAGLFLIALIITQATSCKSTEEKVGEAVICEAMKNAVFYNQNAECGEEK